jgi:hypothetical protein
LRKVKFKLSQPLKFNNGFPPQFRAARHKRMLEKKLGCKKFIGHLSKLNGLALVNYPYTGPFSRNVDIEDPLLGRLLPVH